MCEVDLEPLSIPPMEEERPCGPGSPPPLPPLVPLYDGVPCPAAMDGLRVQVRVDEMVEGELGRRPSLSWYSHGTISSRGPSSAPASPDLPLLALCRASELLLLLCLMFRPVVFEDVKSAMPSKSGNESLLADTMPEGNDKKSIVPELICLGEPDTVRGEASTGGSPILNVCAAGGAERCFSGWSDDDRVCTDSPAPGLSGEAPGTKEELALRLTLALTLPLPNVLATICRCLCKVCCDGDSVIVALRDSVCGAACNAAATGGRGCEC